MTAHADAAPSSVTTPPVVTPRLGRRSWYAMAGGVLLVVIGVTAPWFVVGPASRLGLADDGWVCLVAAPLMLAGAIGARVTGRTRWLHIVVVGAGITVAAVVTALATPPDAMSVSGGSLVTLLGAGVAATGALVGRRDLQAPTDPPAETSDEPIADPVVDRAPPSVARRSLRWVARVAGVVAAAVITLAVWPVDIDDLRALPDPVAEYSAARQRFAEVTADEAGKVYEPCRSRLFDQGRRTDVAVVLFHGLTNCPRQYEEMAVSLFEQGANVVVLRAPGHGLADASGDGITGAGALHTLTARELADYADDAIDIALGLGDDVRVHGLSMGGVLSLWSAQYRPDVERVVSMAPAFELPAVPNAVSNWFTNVFSRTPSITLSHERRIDHDYAGFSSRGLAASFALGQAVMADGLDTGPIIDDVTVVLNPDDPLVSDDDIEAMVNAWDRVRDVVEVVVLEPTGLPHDAIDVAQPDADPDAVYPVIMEALGFEWTGLASPVDAVDG